MLKKSTNLRRMSILLVLAMVFSVLMPVIPAGAATSKAYLSSVGLDYDADTMTLTADPNFKYDDYTADDATYKFTVKKGAKYVYRDKKYNEGYELDLSEVIDEYGEGAYKAMVSAKAKNTKSSKYITFDVEQAKEDISLTAINATVEVGKTVAADVTVDPADADLTFTSSNTAVATVAADGTITGKKEGIATITVTATADGYADAEETFTVTVTKATIGTVAVTATPETAELNVGGTQQITATADPSDATITYASSDAAVAEVSATGLITAKAAGTATITVTGAKTDYTSGTDTVVVTVTAAPAALTVTGVSAVTGTTIKVTGTNFTATNVADLATQLTIKNTATPTTTYPVSAPVFVSATEATMTCETIANTVTSVTWTWTPATGNPVTGTFAGETTKPTLTSLTALNATQLEVVFSEQLSTTSAETVQNYTLYNIAAGKSQGLSTNQSTAILGADKKTVTITLGGTDISGAPAGMFGLNGFLPTAYMLYVDQSEATKVQDLAGNEVVLNSNLQFTGITAVDTVAPQLVSASFNTSTNVLSLSFNESIKKTDTYVDETKITLSGTGGSVLLTESDYTGAGADGNSIDMTLSTTTANAFKAFTGNYSVSIAAGAIKDVSLNNIENQTATITMNIPPALNSASYDAVMHRLTLTFNKTVSVNSVINNISEITLKRTGTTVTLSNASTVLTSANSSTILIQLGAVTYAAWEAATVTSPTVSITAQKIQDTATTPLTNAAITDVTIAYTADTTALAPTAAAYDESTKVLTVTFNRNISTTAAVTVADIEVDNGTSKVFDFTGYSYNDTPAAATYKRTNPNQLAFMLQTAGTDHQAAIRAEYEKPEALDLKVVFKAQSVQDTLGNKIAASNNSITYTDNVKPQVAAATDSVGTTTLKVVFNEKVDATTATDVANYAVTKSDDATVTLALSSPVMLADKKTVFFTTSNQQSITWKLTVTNVKDLAGNVISSTANNTDTFTASSDPLKLVSNTTNRLVDADSNNTLSNGDYIVLVFNKPVSVKTSANGLDLRFNGSDLNDATAAAIFGSGYQVIKGEGPNEVKVVMGDKPSAYSTSALWAAAVIGKAINTNSTATQNIYAGTLTSPEYVTYDSSKDNTVREPSTGTAPKISAAVFNDVDSNGRISENDTIVLTMNQKVSAGVGAASTDEFAIDLNGTTAGNYAAVDTIIKSVAATDSTTVTIVLNSTASKNEIVPGTSKIDIDDSATINVKNGWAIPATYNGTTATNGANSETADITIARSDNVKPTLVSWKHVDTDASNTVNAGDVVVMTFSEPVQLYAATTEQNLIFSTNACFSTTGDGTWAVISDPAGLGGYQNTQLVATLLTGANLFSGATLQISPADLTNIRDGNANPLDAQAPVAIDALSLGGTASSTRIATTSTDLVAAAIDTNVNTIVLGQDIALGAELVLNNGAKTIDLNGKTLTTGANNITITANDSTIKNGTIAQAANNITLGGAGTGSKYQNVVFSGTGVLTNDGATDRTYQTVSFGGNLTATKALTLNGATWTANGTLTATQNVTTTGDITIAATKTLTLTGAAGPTKLIGSLGTEKITGAGTLATAATAIQVEKVVIETGVSGVVASTVFKTVSFTPSAAKTVTIDANAEFNAVSWNSNTTVSVATGVTLTLNGAISNGKAVTCAGTGVALLGAGATVETGVDAAPVQSTFANGNNKSNDTTFVLKGTLAAADTIKIGYGLVTLDSSAADEYDLLKATVAQRATAGNIASGGVAPTAGNIDAAVDAFLTITVATGKTLTAGTYTVTHAQTAGGANEAFATSAAGTADGTITVMGITKAFTFVIS